MRDSAYCPPYPVSEFCFIVCSRQNEGCAIFFAFFNNVFNLDMMFVLIVPWSNDMKSEDISRGFHTKGMIFNLEFAILKCKSFQKHFCLYIMDYFQVKRRTRTQQNVDPDTRGPVIAIT